MLLLLLLLHPRRRRCCLRLWALTTMRRRLRVWGRPSRPGWC